MSPNRRADIQRKLALAPVPKPPAGLADRIKSEIPRELLETSERDRKRLSQSVAFNMRVAASIILLIGTSYLALTILSRAFEETRAIERTEKILAREESNARPMPAAVDALQQESSKAAAPKTPPPATAPLAVASANEAAAKQQQQPFRAAEQPSTKEKLVAKDERRLFVEDAMQETKVATANEDHGRVGRRDEENREALKKRENSAEGPAGKEVAGTAAPVNEAITITASAPVVAEPPASAATTGAAAPPPAAASSRTVSSENDRDRQQSRSSLDFSAGWLGPPAAQAADLALGAPATLFNIPLKPMATAAVTSRIERFAAPPQPPSRVRIEAEAAPAPFDEAIRLVRISLDLPSSKLPPVGSDATLTIEFDPASVRSHRPITIEPSTTERVLIAQTSMTALYEVELDPTASRRAVVAKVTLRYKSVRNGDQQSIVKLVRRGDVAKSWDAASKRMKAASLAAAIGNAPQDAIVVKAKAAGLDALAEALANESH